MERLGHGFPAFKDASSTVLVLGSFPSVKSREQGFFYMHPQNRFWRVLTAVTGSDFAAADVEGRRVLLARHGIALYDVVEACVVVGSSDASIEDVVPADLKAILAGTRITKILVNGGKAWRLFQRYDADLVALARPLPSTSPANARMDLAALVARWRIEFER